MIEIHRSIVKIIVKPRMKPATLWQTNMAIENGRLIVDLLIYLLEMVIFHSYVNVYQRVRGLDYRRISKLADWFYIDYSIFPYVLIKSPSTNNGYHEYGNVTYYI